MCVFQILGTPITQSTERKTTAQIQINDILVVNLTIGWMFGEKRSLYVFRFEYIESVTQNEIKYISLEGIENLF